MGFKVVLVFPTERLVTGVDCKILVSLKVSLTTVEHVREAARADERSVVQGELRETLQRLEPI